MDKKNVILIVLIILILGSVFVIYRKVKTSPVSSFSPSPSQLSSATPTPTAKESLVEPIAEFKTRITKKPFGIYITPVTSPVQPEKFTGYHAGVDVEYQDIVADVPVYAPVDGTIVLARTASGYGGVLILDSTLPDGSKHSLLFGHLRPSSLPSVGTQIKKGDQIGLLGIGYSAETDGERRHLHFAILSDNRLDLRGYVASESELSGWLNPLDLYQ